MPNTVRLLELADWLDAGIFPGEWDFLYWGKVTECGTHGCAIGLAGLAEVAGLKAHPAILTGDLIFTWFDTKSKRQYTKSRRQYTAAGVAAAEAAFDLTNRQALNLFVSPTEEALESHKDAGDPYADPESLVTPSQVADRIRRFCA